MVERKPSPDVNDVMTMFERSAWVHPSARIGSGTVVYPFVFVGPYVEIGRDCVIGPGASIGQPGFKYDEEIYCRDCGAVANSGDVCTCFGGHPTDRRRLVYREHSAGVRIGDDVHIGANACVDQGRWRPTEIRNGAKIDNNCHVAHNVQIGHNARVIANAMLAGSVTVGDWAIISPGACVREHLTIGERSMLGLGAVAVKDVPPGEVWVGNPARFLRRVDE